MLKKLGLVVAVVCMSLCVTIPAASAATGTADSSAKAKAAYTHKGQDRLIKRLRTQVATITKAIATLTGQSASNGSTISAIIGGVPDIVNGLTALKDGLTKLGSAYQAVEYGVVTVSSNAAGSIGVAPAWTADIPDDGNAASVAGTAVVSLAAGQARTFSVVTLVRSNESDAGANGPVAQGGAPPWVEPPPGVGSTILPCGETGSVSVTPTGEAIQTPDGVATDKNLVNINNGRSRTDQELPGNDDSHLANCSITAPATGAYVVHYSASLFDIPTTRSPGPTE